MTTQSKYLIETTAPEIQALALQLFIDDWKPFEGLWRTLCPVAKTGIAVGTGNDVLDRMVTRAFFREQIVTSFNARKFQTTNVCAVYEVRFYIDRLRKMHHRDNDYSDNNFLASCLAVEQVLLVSYRPKVNVVPRLPQMRERVGWLEHCESVLARIEF